MLNFPHVADFPRSHHIYLYSIESDGRVLKNIAILKPHFVATENNGNFASHTQI